MATKARHLKTPTQLWIADNRKRLGLSPKDLATLTDVTEDTARGWESRGRPSEDALTILERRFGVPRPIEMERIGQSDLVAALAAQTAAITELVTELRLARLGRADDAHAAIDEAARLDRPPLPPEDPPAPVPQLGRGPRDIASGSAGRSSQ